MNPDPLPHLETFARAAELTSFTAAAQALQLTQAAVSQRIQALEKELGVALFQRQGGHVLLTDAGRRLYAYAQSILDLHRQARQDVTGRQSPLTGELVLAASSIPGEYLLPAILSVFRRQHPHIQVRATITDSQAVLSQVEQGRAHLGLVGGKRDDLHLEFRCFACDQLVLVVPAGHPWERRKQVSLAQLCEQPLILREGGSGSRWCLEHALQRAGKSAKDLHIALELGGNDAIKEAVRRGLGLAVLSIHAVKPDIQSGRLHGLKVAGLCLKRKMFAVWDRRRVQPIPAKLFLALLEPCAGAKAKS
jgi:DNA-binding transcriptional LysR family regulator